MMLLVIAGTFVILVGVQYARIIGKNTGMAAQLRGSAKRRPQLGSQTRRTSCGRFAG